MTDRYYARSASDRTQDWPLWFAADASQGGLNVTAPKIRELMGLDVAGLPFLSKINAEKLAAILNAQETKG